MDSYFVLVKRDTSAVCGIFTIEHIAFKTLEERGDAFFIEEYSIWDESVKIHTLQNIPRGKYNNASYIVPGEH